MIPGRQISRIHTYLYSVGKSARLNGLRSCIHCHPVCADCTHFPIKSQAAGITYRYRLRELLPRVQSTKIQSVRCNADFRLPFLFRWNLIGAANVRKGRGNPKKQTTDNTGDHQKNDSQNQARQSTRPTSRLTTGTSGLLRRGRWVR